MLWHHQCSLESRHKEMGEGDPEPKESTLIAELTKTHFLLLAEDGDFK